MPDMKFKYSIQDYQTKAVQSVADVFSGQPYEDSFIYRRQLSSPSRKGVWASGTIEENDISTGFGNSVLHIGPDTLLDNLHDVQKRNNIPVSDALTTTKLGACSLDVEMETGTGKTYVYIKTMFELHKRYGWSKFIVVVPSIAIREGVFKSFQTMQDHFMEEYGKKARFFIYNSKNLTELDQYSQSPDINVMIINVQAFNARGKDARRITMELDDFGSRKPIDIIKANRPIVILDEPQKMGGKATQAGLKEFNPLFTINYSATHKQHHDLVYALDAVDAYNQKLVKKIEVKGFEVHNLRGTDGYMYLEEILVDAQHPPRARIEFEIDYAKSVNRETRIVSVDDSVYELSKHMDQYKGYRVSDINPLEGSITFTNGEVLHVGETVGDISSSDLRRIQIRETIRSHFEKEQTLYEKGIKVLSLFFIDEVAKYRQYDEDGNEVNSEYGSIFEEEYEKLCKEYRAHASGPYGYYLDHIQSEDTHAGYFSVDKQGRKVDSSIKRGSDESDDISAYDLILKDKERLLSMDNPVRFIFSHSALREGWDNPNVFQICTLKHGGSSPTQKRQEVGRGLRLCVNQSGIRMDEQRVGKDKVQSINRLTVIASDGYTEFVSDLQKGISEDLYERPAVASEEFFEGKTIRDGEDEKILTRSDARQIYKYLLVHDYIDDDDTVTDAYRSDVQRGTLAPLPHELECDPQQVHALIQSTYAAGTLNGMIANGRDTKVVENELNENFQKKEFQKLWKYINHSYSYRVSFNTEELIGKAVHHINEKLNVAYLQYTVTSGTQNEDISFEGVKAKKSFDKKTSQTHAIYTVGASSVKLDLVGAIADKTKLTRRTVVRILTEIKPSRFSMYARNPNAFIANVSRLINEQKMNMLVEHIAYNTTEKTYDASIFTEEKHMALNKAYVSKKNIQRYVFTDGTAQDGQSVEYRFAESLDHAKEVSVYAKLPKGFSIPTPAGNYSPDWAIAFDDSADVKHIFFVAETKGSMSSLNLRTTEQAKIECARKLFREATDGKVTYDTVDSYESLMNIVAGHRD